MANKNPKIIPEQIHIVRTAIIKSVIDCTSKFSDEPMKYKSLGLKLGKEIGHNFEDGAARYRLFFDFQALDEEDKELGLSASIGLEYHFMVDNFKDFLSEEDGEHKIDLQLGSTLMAIAYSTSRGIIFERTSNTYFDGIMLPVIDPKNFLLEGAED
jgi:hypothetical protein